MSLHELTRIVSGSKILKCGILLVLIMGLLGEFKAMYTRKICNGAEIVTTRFVVDKPSRATTIDAANSVIKNVIAPGELPGYTGWARPENTLARYFSIKSISTSTTLRHYSSKFPSLKGYEYVIIVKCEGHKDCTLKEDTNNSETKGKDNNDNGVSLFFLRAYGPAVIPGIVTSRFCSSSSIEIDLSAGGTDGCYYEITFVFYDPGPYTIEVVLTFSRPPRITAFPIDNKLSQNEPHYEGYLLPGFPLMTSVVLEEGKPNTKIISEKTTKSASITESAKETDLCKVEDLVETSPNSAMEKARWMVTGKVNEKEYSSRTMNSSVVSTIGYINNVNSLGINMEYRYLNDCLITPESYLDKNLFDDRCSGSKNKLHIVYIGDSVLRAQKDMLKDLLKSTPSYQVEFTFVSLHGGYRKNQVLGPTNVEAFLKDLRLKTKTDENVVILFNTGLHDIHRLCGAEFWDERPTYLDRDRLSSGSFACVDEYRALLKDFLDLISEFPAALKVFQSTTAAWPKYGNYGIGWKQNAQDMVLVSDFCAAFNDIAFEVLADYKNSNIDIMDGYWITYPRPDNREVGDIGNKLSHPGAEVLSVMTRKWLMLILDRACLPI